MGSASDLSVMNEAAEFLKKLQIPYEITIVSAHRTPERMFDYAKNAHAKGIKVIIAGAGGAARRHHRATRRHRLQPPRRRCRPHQGVAGIQPVASRQRSFKRSRRRLTNKNIKRSPAASRPSCSCTVRARPSNERRISTGSMAKMTDIPAGVIVGALRRRSANARATPHQTPVAHE